MIAYVRLVTNNFDKAAAFYDAFLGQVQASRIIDSKHVIAWSTSINDTAITISKRKEEDPEIGRDGHMVAFALDTPEEVDAMYNKGLELGASAETAVTLLDNGFYSGYLRDLDGHQLRVFCVTA